MPYAQPRNRRRDVLLEYLFKPNLGVGSSVDTLIEAVRFVVFVFRHSIHDLTSVGIREGGYIPCHF